MENGEIVVTLSRSLVNGRRRLEGSRITIFVSTRYTEEDLFRLSDYQSSIFTPVLFIFDLTLTNFGQRPR